LNPASGDWAAPQKANTALGRYGSVDEVAALVSFVAGPEASYITGANLTVDGGFMDWKDMRGGGETRHHTTTTNQDRVVSNSLSCCFMIGHSAATIE
jgi:hypothetical protein